jgi:hypothetical protein
MIGEKEVKERMANVKRDKKVKGQENRLSSFLLFFIYAK